MRDASTARQRTEEHERANLAPWGTRSAETKGRDRPEEPERWRTVFQQDRERLLHCVAFRRLAGKTHRLGVDAHPVPRLRLSHALEVSQAARTIARGLRLNEDLAEAVALGAEIGNTAFGVAGEEALSIFEGGFDHAEQGLRIVERLEADGRGLNLTWEVRDGILHHRRTAPEPATVEAEVVRAAHRITALSRDLESCVAAGFVDDQVPADVATVLHGDPQQRIAAFIDDVVTASLDRPTVRTSPRVAELLGSVERFLQRGLHRSPALRTKRNKAIHCLRSVAVFYLENPDELPGGAGEEDPVAVRVRDRMAALTDREALEEFHRLFSPEPPA